MSSLTTLDITPSPRLLSVLGDIPLQPWQCLAELVDNSLDELLKQTWRTEEDPLIVDIELEDQGHQGVFLVVSDNGQGMARDELERSLRAGHSARSRYGSLGLFGMGFNIATARLGNVTQVTTTVQGSGERLRATIDFAEIQRRESFSVPLEIETCDRTESGTSVKVLLKREMAESFKRSATQRTLMGQLGDVYSFLLRDSVPGLSREGYSAKIPAIVRFNGEPIEAKLPCIWSDQRSVTSKGQQVCAVQYVDLRLTAATACLDCGFWDRKNGPESCEECGSRNLSLRERRIWGWLGVQRYLDSSSYGIDFIRYGRKILKQDKSIFAYTDPDTLRTDVEYPVEMPANKGRLVGEIHLDHVPVTYQKNDFIRQSNDWQKAIEVIRGTGPLKPKAADGVNDSPLAVLFSAFRRSDPGLKCLTPGDGKQAMNTKAAEWGGAFDRGVARFLLDTEWFEAAERHDQIKNGQTAAGNNPPATTAAEALLGVGRDAPSASPVDPEPVPQPTQSEALESARLLGTPRSDLSGTFKLDRALGTWDISVVATRESLRDGAGNVIPALQGKVQGTKLEVFVSTEHPIFKEYGRDVRDVALLQAAGLIRDLKNSDQSVATIYGQLVQEVEDLKVTTASILERIEKTLDLIRGLALPVVEENPDPFWALLTPDERQTVEEAAALKYPTLNPLEVINDGRFIEFCGAEALSKMIEDHALLLFDGVVFKPAIKARGPAARQRIVGAVTRALASLSSFQQDELMRQKHDIQLVQISLDMLEEQLNSEELLV